MKELSIVHFSYDNPLSLLRTVRVLLLAQGISIEKLALEPRTFYEIINEASFTRLGNLSWERIEDGGDEGTILGIPFVQKMNVLFETDHRIHPT